MLRNALEDYLAGIKNEREFDLPLVRLLPLLGYYDVHLTHSPVEFGKDIIAKRRENGAEVQYSIQSKAGKISASTWRREIRPQLLTALLSGLSHPSFDKLLPRHVVLLTMGDLKDHVAIETQSFKEEVGALNPEWSVTFWDKRDLVEFLLEHGLEGVYRATAAGVVEFDRFLLLYVHALQGTITPKEIENHSRQWGELDVDRDRRLLISAIESEVLAQVCIGHGLVYEAVQLHLARLRLLCELAYAEGAEGLRELWDRAVEGLNMLCGSYVDQVREAWIGDRDLVKAWSRELYMTTYPVLCLRLMELASLAYFASGTDEDRARHADFIADFVEAESGCAHPIGDRFAVSLVLVTLVLIDRNLLDEAASLLERATVWMCDRYEAGLGLAGVEADEPAETNSLLGYPFDFIAVPERRQSFLASALMDLGAFLANAALYADIVNDVKACGIIAEYWQPRDTVGACCYEGDDVVQYPGVEYRDELGSNGTEHAAHFADESASFRFVELFGITAAVAIMALLRDRYFPKLWPLMAAHRTSNNELFKFGHPIWIPD